MIRLISTVVFCALMVLSSSTLTAAEADPLKLVDIEAVRLAVGDLAKTYPEAYPHGKESLARLDGYERRLPELRRRMQEGDVAATQEAQGIAAFCREALLANPLLDFDKLLLIRRVPLGEARRPKGDGKGRGSLLSCI